MRRRDWLLFAAGAVALVGCGAQPRALPAELSSTGPGLATHEPPAVLVGSMGHLCMQLRQPPVRGVTYCVGSNFVEELGTTGAFDLPARSDRFLSDDRDLHLGSSMGCAIAATGETRCWGSPHRGVRGDDCTLHRHGGHVCGGVEVANETSPRQVLGVPALRELAGGWDHTCGRSDAGEVWCWGSNDEGQVGRAELDLALVPVRVDVPPALELHSGANHMCTVSRDTRDLWCWGTYVINDEPDPMERDLRAPKRLATRGPLPADARLRLTQRGVCILGGDAQLQCWGEIATDADGPVEIAGLDLVSNGAFTCVLDRHRQVACYADAAFVGGDDGDGRRWRPVSLPTRAPIADLFATHNYACAISEAGEVACWGDTRLGFFELGAPRLVLDPARLAR